MKLILIRHAKSSWADPTQTDHARPLNQRGRDAAPRIGKWLAQRGHIPDLILCSDAARTRETCALIAPLIGAPNTTYLPQLYHASPLEILNTIRPHQTRIVAVIGHNPGLAELAHRLVQTPPDHPDFHRYPTAATTILDTDLSPGLAQVIDFIVPRDLPLLL